MTDARAGAPAGAGAPGVASFGGIRLRAIDGGPLEGARLFRSASLSRITEHEAAFVVGGLGVRSIYDLRNRWEVASSPEPPAIGNRRRTAQAERARAGSCPEAQARRRTSHRGGSEVRAQWRPGSPLRPGAFRIAPPFPTKLLAEIARYERFAEHTEKGELGVSRTIPEKMSRNRAYHAIRARALSGMRLLHAEPVRARRPATARAQRANSARRLAT